MALAVVAATVAGCGSGDRSEPTVGPPPTTSSSASAAYAVGPPPAIPLWKHGVLRANGDAIRTPLSRLVTGGGTTVVGRSGEHESTWRLVVDGRLRPLISASGPTVPQVSANGAYVAWVTERTVARQDRFRSTSAFTVTEYDVRKARRMGSTTITRRVECCDAGGVVQALGIDADGTVVLHSLAGPIWTWRPGRPPVRARLAPDNWLESSDQWPYGITFAIDQDGAGPAAYARVDRHGVVHRKGRVPVAATGTWSSDGRYYAYRPVAKMRGTRARALDTTTGQVIRFDSPRNARVYLWESPTSFLLVHEGDVDTQPVAFFRCDVTSGACQRAGRPELHVHLPETLYF